MPKPIEAMPLDEVRERLRYTATSQVSTLEPIDVARMRVTVEALVAVYEEALHARAPFVWTHLRKLVDAVVATKPRRCEIFQAHDRKPDEQCELQHGHEGACVFGSSVIRPEPTPLEALAQALADAGIEFDAGRLNSDRDYFEAKQRSVVWVRCLATDEVPHAGVVGGMYARRCVLRTAHAGPCLYGEP